MNAVLENPGKVWTYEEYLGLGNDAVKLFAETEGLILDPVYTGKAAAAMLAHIREGMFGADEVLVFVHTGGSPAIFTHAHYWT